MKYSKHTGHSSAKEYQWIKQYVPPCPAGEKLSILDVGCGDYIILKNFFTELGYQYFGIDYDPEARALRCDAHHLPFKNSTFDVIFSGETLEHLHSPWLVVPEIGRVAREGALFLGHVPQLYPFHGDSYFNYTFMGIQRILELGDFDTNEIKLGYTVGESLLTAYIAPFKPPKIIRVATNAIVYAALIIRKWIARIYLAGYSRKLSSPTSRKIAFSLENSDTIFAGGLIFVAHKNSNLKRRW